MRRPVPVMLLAAATLATALSQAPADSPRQVAEALADAAKPFVRKLSDPDAAERRAAVSRLGRLGPAAAAAVPALLRTMKEPALQDAAAGALGRIGPAAFPALIGALDDSDPYYCVYLLRAIWQINQSFGVQADDRLLGRLRPLLDKDRPAELRIAAVTVIRQLGPRAAPTIPALIETLAEPARGLNEAVGEALAAIGKPAVPAVLAAMKDRRPAVVLGIGQALSRLGPTATDAVPTLTEWLDNKSWRLRLSAAEALGGMGRAAAPAVDKLTEIAWRRPVPAGGQHAGGGLEAQGPRYAQLAAERALIHLGPLAAPALRDVVLALWHGHPLRHLAAIETIKAIGPAAAEQGIPMLLRLLRDPGWPVKRGLPDALAAMGPGAAKPAIELIGQDDALLKVAGMEVLRRLGQGGAGGLDALIGQIDTADSRARRAKELSAIADASARSARADALRAVRVACLDALAAMGAKASPAIGKLVAMIRAEPDRDLRREAFEVLSAAGAVGELSALLNEPADSLRRESAIALGAMGVKAAPAVPALIQLLGEKQELTQVVAVMALGRIGRPAVGPVTELLGSTYAQLRKRSAEVLWQLGEQGDPAAARLFQLATADQDASVRGAAGRTLGRLTPSALAEQLGQERLRAGLGPGNSVDVRRAVARALGALPGATVARVQLLAGLLGDAELSDAAAAALAQIAGSLLAKAP